ncbi:PTS glucose transporter subunit IIB [Mycoplasma zalophi]|uniref:PTS glucose transporter subunit IIB n=1 Tax=Mycoplasma zalophi TaxID=191287 RepID=A0ABS6DP56_9MOLU|nr:PTS glucose transporter subunit IIB [Mycoplasma zalophi]MBU4691119.1 PTS glucose transporter subunit IIB [Mycoplasma zalophi]MBU4692107.1 PTS glucose transporter subunit IIB [Mycoplasma zalophi]
MQKLHKFLYILSIVCTLGTIKLFWKSYRQKQVNSQLSVENKVKFPIDELINYLNGIENINSVSSTHKILKIELKSRENIQIDKIKSLNSIEGILFKTDTISLITGNNAQYLQKIINDKIQNRN